MERAEPPVIDDADPAIERLLEFLRDGRGFDFTGYKRASLTRRIMKRISDVKLSGPTEYLDHIQAHPEEVAALFDTILINVTGFFRDPDQWEWLQENVLPILLQRVDERPLRLWSAGCSTGQEAYTLAMLLAEELGIDRVTEMVKIYATDVDGAALAEARQGIYSRDSLEAVPEGLRATYFDEVGGRMAFRRDLRRSVVFGRHDILQDAPISRIDFLSCRNLLMYFTTETQSRILNRLHFALRDDGFLFLGRAEMLLTRTNLFVPHDLHHRLFRKAEGGTRTVRVGPLDPPAIAAPEARRYRLRDIAYSANPNPHLLVDANGNLVMASAAAFAEGYVRKEDIGRPLQDLAVSHRPVDLVRQIEVAARERRPVDLANIARVGPSDVVTHIDISVLPLSDADGVLVGTAIHFHDVTRYERLRAELQQVNSDLETAYEELQSTNEELLTTNEELQSTIEELETTNEELQSANEELETMNEELQSSNVEQEEVNEELTRRTRELDDVRSTLLAFVGTIDGSVVVVDPTMQVRMWDEVARETWGWRAEEVVGTDLADLDSGIPIQELMEVIDGVLQSTKPAELDFDAHDRRGRQLRCHAQVLPLRDKVKGNLGAAVLIRSEVVG